MTKNQTTISKIALIMGVALVFLTGYMHFIELPEYFFEDGKSRLKGVMFLINSIVAVISAIGIARGSLTWGWKLGALIAGGSFIFYMIDRLVGIPFLWEQGSWDDSNGYRALVVEAAFVALYIGLFTPKTPQLTQSAS